MLIAILGDCHLGARNASTQFSKHFNRFFQEVFYPYLIKHGVKEIIQLGDLFDNRTSISIKAYHACKSVWFDPLVENDIRMTTLLGNHDIFFKSTLEVNAPELFLKNEYPNHIRIVSKPSVIDYAGTPIAFVPWIVDDNKEAVFNFMARDKVADICCGHFEIAGFEMMRGVVGHGNIPRQLFENFELTLSGHYHTKSHDDFYRIHYVGTPYEITFADLHDPRGFHIFDTDTRELTFIPNPYTMFERIVYNEGWAGDLDSLTGKSIKLVVEKKKDLYQFDRFVDSVKLKNPYQLSIIENFQDLHGVEVKENIVLENSQQIINQYIDALDTSVDKDRLKSYMAGLYTEALSE